MSELDIEGVLTSWFVNMSEGSVGGQYQRMRVAEVAAVLREQIAAWLESEGKREMHERGGHWHTVTASDVHVARKLAALAAQVAPSRVPGEGS